MNETVSTIATNVTANNVLRGYAAYKALGGNGHISSIVGTIDASTLAPKKKAYRCAYCGTLHEHNTGTCDRCGAPMSEAAEVKE